MGNKCHECKSREIKVHDYPCNECKHRPPQEYDHFEPAEPVVLSADDLIIKHLHMRGDGVHDAAFITSLVLMCRQNYRLERDLELRGLVERAEAVNIKGAVDMEIFSQKLSNLRLALKNLKPLNQD